MQQSFKIPVLDLYHDRVSMILWPKFTALFQSYIDTVNRVQAAPRLYAASANFQTNVHPLTKKYINFIVGVY